MNTKFSIKNYLEAHSRLSIKLDLDSIYSAVELVTSKIYDGKKIITCGNGGSAHNASHYITDWNKMYNIATGKRLNGFCLCDNVGLITAFANDLNYDQIFSGQLKSILSEGDLVICLSGSGNSRNVIEACKYAKDNNASTLAIVGYDGGELIKLSDYAVHVPSFDMQLCEDIHLKFGHMVMKSICKSDIIE